MGICLTASSRPIVRVLDEVEVRFLAEQSVVPQVGRRKQQELNYCKQADLVVTRSAYDLEVLRNEIPALNGIVLPPVGNINEFLNISPDESKPFQLLFCGALNRTANIEGLLWFVESVLPHIQEAVPCVRLSVTGAYPSPVVMALGSRPRIEVIGYTPDLREWYSRARVIIAPIFVTGGSQNKVRDGLAAGRPVVATYAANRGVNAPCVLLADDPVMFANHVIKLLLDDNYWTSISEASRQFAQDNFQWHVDAVRLEARYEELLQNTRKKR